MIRQASKATIHLHRRLGHSMALPGNPQTPTELLSALPEKFEQARQSGQLFFFPSQAKDVSSQGRRFNLRCCPALQDKARAKTEALAAIRKDGSPDHKRPRNTEETKQNSAEPFKPPYVPELFLGCLEGIEGEPGMSILLNKYAVLPEHMLLCPPEYQSQSLPPTPHQLALAYLILIAAARHPNRPRRLLAFYNGGVGAGASQSWRHLQFVEVPGGRAPVEEWTDSVMFERPDEPIVHPTLKHLQIIHPLNSLRTMPHSPSAQDTEKLINYLAPALMKTLDIAFDALRRGGGDKDGGWNLLMTLDHLHLIPRSAPSFAIPPHESVELNSLGYAGMMLVKSEEEEEALLQAVDDQGGLMTVLERCGVPRGWGEQAIEGMSLHLGVNDMA